jgi:hypothetical protein
LCLEPEEGLIDKGESGVFLALNFTPTRYYHPDTTHQHVFYYPEDFGHAVPEVPAGPHQGNSRKPRGKLGIHLQGYC